MRTERPTVRESDRPSRAPRWCALVLALAAVAWTLAPASAQDAQKKGAARSAAPLAAQPSSAAQAKPLLGDQTDGSRARPVHAIPLRDPEGEVIRPTDKPLLPFSTRQTCGADCHDVATIGRGWHFTVMDRAPGKVRRGEPWILADPETATQLPLSYHGWPGTFHPEQVGLTPLKFAVMFGGRTPGGLTGSRERNPEQQARWVVSGELEPNCLACHDASPSYDHAEYGRQVRLENFRWAAPAASNIAAVSGSAREMPNPFDYLMPWVEDALLPRMPSVSYPPERFLPGAKLAFDIVREVPERRCYFCHSTVDVAQLHRGRANRDEDIHLARGMTCVDCHQNGLDHAMTRGYEADGPAAASTCRGCHLANEADRNFARGRFGAPYPKHAGLPPIHLTKLSCTACHSGPRPEAATRAVKTSMAHRLGGLGVNKAEDALPHLYYPVFVEQPDKTTSPNRLMWPAFWGRLVQGTVTPLEPEHVKRVMAKAKIALKLSATGDWPAVDDALLARVLGLLSADATLRQPPTGSRSPIPDSVVPVYIAGGTLHRLDASGKLVAEKHAAANPYVWPIAHDVRPASQALGARGCTDCHSAGAPIFFGQVGVDSPLVSERRASWPMSRFQKSVDTGYLTTFATTFRYRPWLKAGVTAAAALLMLFVLAFALSGVQSVSAATTRGRWLRLLANVVTVGCCAASAATGLPALLSGAKLTGFALMLHVATVPAFAVGAVLAALFWSQRNALGAADWNRLRRPIGRAARQNATTYFVLARKAFFWIALVASVPAMASATLAMFPLLPSIDQDTLFLAHRYAVAVLVAAALLFLVSALVSWRWGGADHGLAAPGLNETGSERGREDVRI